MPDRLFDDPQMAAVYDTIDSDRSDLDHYEALLAELGAESVLDIGCGTGALALRLAEAGRAVHGADPATGMLAVARERDVDNAVTWHAGTVGDVPAEPRFDAAVMTGNVAQVFLTDEDWLATLVATRQRLTDDGYLVFETRDPQRRAWERWTREATTARYVDPVAGELEAFVDLTDVSLPFVTFSSCVRFLDTGDECWSESTLRFRTRTELDRSLADAGFEVVEVRDAPDRPTLEFVYVAQRA